MGPKDTPTMLKERIDTALNAMRSLGMDTPDEKHTAADYISRLDSRFAEMKTTLNNHVTAGVAKYPCTLLEAYTIANNWKKTTTYQGTTTSVFATLAKVDKTPPDENESKKKSKKKGQKETEQDPNKKDFLGDCIRCGKPGHLAKNCPYTEAIKRAVEESEETARALATFTNANASNNTNTTLYSAFITVLRTNVSSPMTNKVLLDNQAQSSIFGNGDLLENIEDRETTVEYTGLNKEVSIKVTKCGVYKGLRVDYHPDLDVNIVSFSQAKDVCSECGYLPTEDMIADGFTKPLQGEAFRRFRKEILNC